MAIGARGTYRRTEAAAASEVTRKRWMPSRTQRLCMQTSVHKATVAGGLAMLPSDPSLAMADAPVANVETSRSTGSRARCWASAGTNFLVAPQSTNAARRLAVRKCEKWTPS